MDISCDTLDVRLDQLKTVEIKKVEHQKKILEKELEVLENELIVKETTVIDVEPEKE